MIAGVLFLSWRIFELLVCVPIVGMLAWFVQQYQRANQLTPDYILVLFIVSCLALGWIVATTIAYATARHNAFLIAFVDFLFIGALIGAVVVMRGVGSLDCSNFGGAGVTTSGSYFNLNINKTCAMLKASFALAIILILAFAVTFFLALLVQRSHRSDDRVVVKRQYSGSHGSRRGQRRSSSRGSRGYDRPRTSSRSHYSRRQYYV